MFTLLKKLWFMLKGFANDITDRSANPEMVFRQAARELAEQRSHLREVWVSLDTQAREHTKQLESKQNDFERYKSEAKKLRETDESKAIMVAERCIKLDKWINMAQDNVEMTKTRMSTIEDEINRLKFEEDNLELEASLAKSTMSMSTVENNKHNAGKTSSAQVREMIESARSRVQSIESETTSNRRAYEKFDNDEQPQNVKAKDFLDSL